MNPRDKARARTLAQAVTDYDKNTLHLRGLLSAKHLETLVAQFIDSLRRVEFALHLQMAVIAPIRMDPTSSQFDPLKAAVLRNRRGETDEAWWLVFIATHCGKHAIDGWRLTRDIYGKLGQGGLWDWATISQNPSAFESWLTANEATLRGGDGVSRRFSNHRKYESLKSSSANGIAKIFASYVAWVAPPRKHAAVVQEIHKTVGQNPHDVFAALYNSLDAVQRFGRLGKFDFLAMLGKLGIAPIEPGTTFLKGATGPLAGARLLFAGNSNSKVSAAHLQTKLVEFGQKTGLGSQVLEDAICNWQKAPDVYIRFKG